MRFPKDCNPRKQCRDGADIREYESIGTRVLGHPEYWDENIGTPILRGNSGNRNNEIMGHPFLLGKNNGTDYRLLAD